MLHTVNSFRMMVTCKDESTAFDLRHNISRNCTEQLARIIESVYGRMGADEPWVRIESIEVDLGTVHPDAFEMHFYNTFRERLESELAGRQHNGVEGKISAGDHREEILEYFLVNGSLPWWADATVADPGLIFRELLDGNEVTIKQLLTRHQENPAFWQRISLQFDDTVFTGIISLSAALQAAEKFLQQKIYRKPTYENEQLKLLIRQFIISVAPEWFRVHWDEGTEHSVLLFNEFLRWYDEEAIPGSNDLPVNIPRTTHETLATEMLAVQGKETPLMPVPEKLVLKQAGIVLLAPFLEIFLSRLHLWTKTGWRRKAGQHRAVHLLHYLATAELQAPEYQVFFEKILCGMDAGETLARHTRLHNDEIQEANILLEDVIGHWKALKNTSITALQQSFFKRDGLLWRKDGDWILNVERKTIDVLLESIPWGYSTIRLPWTNFVLYVEW